MKHMVLLLVSALLPALVCTQEARAAERLHIEGIEIGMTSDEFEGDLRAKGWVSGDDRKRESMQQAFGGALPPPRGFTLGTPGEPGTRGLGIRYDRDRSGGGQEYRVKTLSVNHLLEKPRGGDWAVLAGQIQQIFNGYVKVYGKADACEPYSRPGVYKRCTWTRQFNGVDETLVWQLGLGGRPSLQLTASPVRPSVRTVSAPGTASGTSVSAGSGNVKQDSTTADPANAGSRPAVDVDTVLENTVGDAPEPSRVMTCRTLQRAIQSGGNYFIGDVAVVKGGVLLASKMPAACMK